MADEGTTLSNEAADHTTVTLRGRVVWMAEAMRRLHGAESDADGERAIVALETEDGRLLPILKDTRGRAFHKDPRWMGVPMELVARRYRGSPMLQVVRTYNLKDGKKYEVDYWCDICAIPMFELKECECCQGPIRIREQLVEDAAP